MNRINKNAIPHYKFSNMADHDLLAHAVFTRHGGVSESPFDTMNIGITVGDPHDNVRENIRRMSATLGTPTGPIYTTRQVHGSDVVVVSEDTSQSDAPPDADGIITNIPGVKLLMRFADCVPIILYDPVLQVVGLAHAGWRGTLAKVGAETVAAMQADYGSQAKDIMAGIGPSIGPNDYEVGEEVAEQVREVFGSAGDDFLHYPNGAGMRPYFDLWESNKYVLKEAGVLHIETAAISTAQYMDEFYSYRMEPAPTGRFGVMAMLKEPQSSDD